MKMELRLGGRGFEHSSMSWQPPSRITTTFGLTKGSASTSPSRCGTTIPSTTWTSGASPPTAASGASMSRRPRPGRGLPLYLIALESLILGLVPYLFHRPDGSLIKDGRKTWKTATAAAGYPNKLFHDFRRSAFRSMEIGVPRTVATIDRSQDGKRVSDHAGDAVCEPAARCLLDD